MIRCCIVQSVVASWCLDCGCSMLEYVGRNANQHSVVVCAFVAAIVARSEDGGGATDQCNVRVAEGNLCIGRRSGKHCTMRYNHHCGTEGVVYFLSLRKGPFKFSRCGVDDGSGVGVGQ